MELIVIINRGVKSCIDIFIQVLIILKTNSSLQHQGFFDLQLSYIHNVYLVVFLISNHNMSFSTQRCQVLMLMKIINQNSKHCIIDASLGTYKMVKFLRKKFSKCCKGSFPVSCLFAFFNIKRDVNFQPYLDESYYKLQFQGNTISTCKFYVG